MQWVKYRCMTLVLGTKPSCRSSDKDIVADRRACIDLACAFFLPYGISRVSTEQRLSSAGDIVMHALVVLSASLVSLIRSQSTSSPTKPSLPSKSSIKDTSRIRRAFVSVVGHACRCMYCMIAAEDTATTMRKQTLDNCRDLSFQSMGGPRAQASHGQNRQIVVVDVLVRQC